MAKKLSKLSLRLWGGGVLLAVLFFVFDMGRKEGFRRNSTSTSGCSSYTLQGGCKANNCTWNTSTCSNNSDYNSQPAACQAKGGTYTGAYCS